MQKRFHMNRIHCAAFSFLLLMSSTHRMQSVTCFQYIHTGINIASVVAFVWGMSAVKCMIQDLLEIAYLNNVNNQSSCDLDMKVKRQQSYLLYLQSIEERLKAAYLLKYTPDNFLAAANFSDEERALAAQLQLIDIDGNDDNDDVTWYVEEFESDDEIEDDNERSFFIMRS